MIYNNTIPTVERSKIENKDIEDKIEILINNILTCLEKVDEIKREVDNVLDAITVNIFTRNTMIIKPLFAEGMNYGLIRDKDWLLSFNDVNRDNNTINLTNFESPNISASLIMKELNQTSYEIKEITDRYDQFLSILKNYY